jgi:hypothetical protein
MFTFCWCYDQQTTLYDLPFTVFTIYQQTTLTNPFHKKSYIEINVKLEQVSAKITHLCCSNKLSL